MNKEISTNFSMLKNGIPEARRPRVAIAPADLRLMGEYAAALDAVGAEPVPMERGPRGYEQLQSSQALVMTSVTVEQGYDVPEKRWTNEPLDTWRWNRHPQRLHLAEWLWDIVCWAEEHKHPTFAAGLSAQLLLARAGGKLVRHVDGHRRQDQNKPEGGIKLQMSIESDGWLAAALEPTEPDPMVEIYCSHHQVPAEPLPAGIQVAGRTTEDGYPHAWALLSDKGKPWAYCVQSEPQHVDDPGYGRAMIGWFVRQLGH